jgi:putative hydrolase of the HAD superfamily
MKYEALIFDLGGTLVPNVPWSVFRDQAKQMAAALSVPEEDYVERWFAQSSGLGLGEFESYQHFIRHVCGQMGISVTENRIEAAAGIPFDNIRRMVTTHREDAVEVLAHLKRSGYKLGLVSDCGPDVPEIWEETPFAPFFDVTVFSCFAGMNKADPRIFNIAVEQLAVEPENCIYVADGMRQELANASGLGMRAVRIVVPGEVDDSPISEDWDGPVISSLKEIFNYME